MEECGHYLESFDIVLLSETWVEDKNYQSHLKYLPGSFRWNWIPAIRSKQRGRPAGGLLVGLKEGLVCKEFKGNARGCWAAFKVKIGELWANVILVYNNTKSQELMRELNVHLEEATMNGEHVVIGGDLNARFGSLGALEESTRRATMDLKEDSEGENGCNYLKHMGYTF